eukprot:scaffold1540_cov359-Prasinococcus_capsulatus_cf.AAC.3
MVHTRWPTWQPPAALSLSFLALCGFSQIQAPRYSVARASCSLAIFLQQDLSMVRPASHIEPSGCLRG